MMAEGYREVAPLKAKSAAAGAAVPAKEFSVCMTSSGVSCHWQFQSVGRSPGATQSNDQQESQPGPAP